jgi:anti-sigma factor RsiW
MMRLLRRPPELACQQMVELVTEYLEGTLSRADRKRFESHIRGCPNCTAYLEQMRATINATGTLRVEDLSPEATEEFIELFRRWQVD